VYQDRAYQAQAALECLEALPEKRRVLLVAPTGMGKTVIATRIISALRERNQNVLLLAHRRELIDQAHARLHEALIPSGIIMAGRYPSLHLPVQVASIDTLRSWAKRGFISIGKTSASWMPNVVIVDEAHRAVSKGYAELLDRLADQGATILGMTATPIRADGVGLAKQFAHMVQTPSILWGMQNGFLVPRVDYYVPFVPKLEGVKIRGGDYDEQQIAEIMDQRHLVGDLVENWVRHARGRQTIVFCSGVQHAIHVAEAFNAAGYPFGHINGETPTKHRDDILTAFRRGELVGLTNDSVFIEGTDVPNVSCVAMARPTRSLGRYLQMIGRGLRPVEGKSSCVVLDHSGSFYQNGRVDRDFHWKLREGKELVEEAKAARKKEPVEFTCRECAFVFSGRVVCPMCGTRIEKTGKFAEYLDAELVQLTVESLEKRKPGVKAKAQFYAELLGYARKNRKTFRWCAGIYKAKWKEWPPFSWRTMVPVEPSPEVCAYVISRGIAFAARQAKERRLAAP